jgi:hypothetical protein
MAYLNYIWIVIGLLLLLLGRKIYWLSVGIIGFALGFFFAPRVLGSESAWLTLIIAIFAGILCALLARYLQTIAVGLVGFIAGGYLIVAILDAVRVQTGNYYWIAILIGGIIGAIFMTVLFDWTLIIITSLIGAWMISQNIPIPLEPPIPFVVFLVLGLVGVVIQAGMRKK